MHCQNLHHNISLLHKGTQLQAHGQWKERQLRKWAPSRYLSFRCDCRFWLAGALTEECMSLGCTWANSRWVISGFIHGEKNLSPPLHGSRLGAHPPPTRSFPHMLEKNLTARAETSPLGGGWDLIRSPVGRLILSSNSALIWSQTRANH